jgi:tetratricopeptide (TPR) repeat protein
MSAASGQQGSDPGDPVLNFEHLWKSLDRNYAQFEVKNVDWNALYKVYRPKVTSRTTKSELWDIMLAMLGHLNDAHVCLSDGRRRISAGIIEEFTMNEFSLDLVKSQYLSGGASSALGGGFTHGWLIKDIGYLHIDDFKKSAEETAAAADAFIEKYGDARGIVIDVRNNPGGTGKVANLVADRFADRKRHYMTSQTRYGEKHDDLGPVQYWNVEPRGPAQYTRPVVLLTNRFTESAADIFALAMRVLPNVTVAGDFTGGAFSAQFPERLPNGWTLWVAYKLLRDHLGQCWDGIGVPPDLRIRNGKDDIEAGLDRVLEFAIQLLERGDLEPQDEAASLANLKTSLVDEFARDVDEKGLEKALAVLDKRRAAGGDAFFLTIDEIMVLAREYDQAKRYEEEIALLQVCREEFPELASTYGLLARAYLAIGKVKEAGAVLEEGATVKPMLPWEAPLIERANNEYLKQSRGSAASIVEEVLKARGIKAAERKFKELLARRERGPVFDESEFNRLGYQLLQRGSLDSALFVFEKNVQLHPDSWNVYDSFAEALVKAGKKKEAIDNYRKSLELNPDNRNGRAVLERLEKGE